MEEEKIHIVLLSGVAGAGKTTASFAFEAAGYYVMEDLPMKMLPGALSLFKSERSAYPRVAFILPLRNVEKAISLIQEEPDFELLCIGLVSRPDVLLSRYKLTRRIHPLMTSGHSLEEAIDIDAENLEEVRSRFDVFIDTSELSEMQLRSRLRELLNKDKSKRPLSVIFTSFGYKFGVPLDADTAIDARVLKNPYWVKGLDKLTGLDQEVIDFIEKDPKTEKLLNAAYSYLDTFLELCVQDGREFVSVGVGCSGGQHRSVYVAEKLYERYSKLYQASLIHREVKRWAK